MCRFPAESCTIPLLDPFVAGAALVPAPPPPLPVPPVPPPPVDVPAAAASAPLMLISFQLPVESLLVTPPDFIADISCAGVIPGLSCFISAAVPANQGAAQLEPSPPLM